MTRCVCVCYIKQIRHGPWFKNRIISTDKEINLSNLIEMYGNVKRLSLGGQVSVVFAFFSKKNS